MRIGDQVRCNKTGRVALAIVAVAFIGFGVETAVRASCSISWDPENETCDVAIDEEQFFSYGEITAVVSFNEGTWTLHQALSAPSNNNIENEDVSPDETEINDGFGILVKYVPTVITGNLIDDQEDGSAILSAWKSPNPEDCSGSETQTIKPNGDSCP